MHQVLWFVGRYEKYVPKFWIEYLYHKFKRIEATPFKREQMFEDFLKIVKKARLNPSCLEVGKYKFNEIIYVEEIRLPIGFKQYDKEAKAVTRDFRYGILSDGTIAASTVDSNDPHFYNAPIAFDTCDLNFCVLRKSDDNLIYWHKNFLQKVKQRDIKGFALDVLVEKSRFAADDPTLILKQQWLDALVKKLTLCCTIMGDDGKFSVRPDALPMRVSEIVEKQVVMSSGYGNASRNRYLLGVSMFRTVIDRYAEWTVHEGLPLEGILEMTIGELVDEYFFKVEKKADALRDEVLKRYGFRTVDMREASRRNGVRSIYDGYVASKTAGWERRMDGFRVYIDASGSVRINDDYICIIGEKSESHLPIGDKIAQRVFAVGTDLRYEIYTLEGYYEKLEEMFDNERRYST